MAYTAHTQIATHGGFYGFVLVTRTGRRQGLKYDAGTHNTRDKAMRAARKLLATLKSKEA